MKKIKKFLIKNIRNIIKKINQNQIQNQNQKQDQDHQDQKY